MVAERMEKTDVSTEQVDEKEQVSGFVGVRAAALSPWRESDRLFGVGDCMGSGEAEW